MSQPITLDDIFALFRESEQQRKEYQQAAEREMNRLREQSDRTDQQIEKTSQEITRLAAQVAQTNKQVGGLTSRWGEFVENLIKPAAARLFQEKGIEVHLTALRVTGQDDQGSIEIDILVENTTEVVAIEVKSHLEVRDVKRFLQTLERFKKAFPKHKNDKLYGAVAGIKIDERVNEYAIQEGLFLIQPAGDSVIIANGKDFKPKIW
ncbi:DUF3782 domain-containing protein [Pseudanabaena sp. FACHB-1277]|uniref:DUF3782 domain-containing protein n=1 Tax=Pseudanabaena cinerea FACHB-1277 TaxID=2949581 RepID=A0A926UWB5_9CYAN|nr:DUF3782 domain-containing protein [Pseudanabaena cinerea]MBD2152370.1 DUF3782 domain-containing protein [Pseudanabaena cinerea FACHB-1277]